MDTQDHRQPRPTYGASTQQPPAVRRKPGDWDCPNAACQEMNFGSRNVCRRCATPRPRPAGAGNNGAQRGQRRAGGRGMAVTLKTGEDTHMTMVYVKAHPSGNDLRVQKTRQEATAEAARWARTYSRCLAVEEDREMHLLALEVGTMWGENSIHVIGALAHAKESILAHFTEHGWEVDSATWGTTPHINLKGRPASILKTHVDILNDWLLI